MELNELEQRLAPFCRAMYEDEDTKISDVYAMAGHAGFAYGFSAESRGTTESWFLRLPPPNVKLVGTADVLRQVAVLNALDGTAVPHCSIKWSGDDPQWFGRPYFAVPKLEGDVIRIEGSDWVAKLDEETRREMARQAMTALASIHKVDPAKAEYLGDAIAFEDDVARWGRFVEKAADPQHMVLVPEVRKLLLDNIPDKAPIGIFHGDFQWSNLFCSKSGQLLAVIDWELVGIGASLNDVGWIATFNDPEAWADNTKSSPLMPDAEDLIAMYAEACGDAVPDVAWYRALAAYKFAIISGFNLMLHRRGKRPDPTWEVTKESIEPLLSRARNLLRS